MSSVVNLKKKKKILLVSGLCPISPGVFLFLWLGLLLSVQGTLWHGKRRLGFCISTAPPHQASLLAELDL